ACASVPKLSGLVVASRNNNATVRAELSHGDPSLMPERGAGRSTRNGIPKPCAPIMACCQHRRSVGAKGDTIYTALVRQRWFEGRCPRNVPNSRGLVGVTRYDVLAIRPECSNQFAALMPEGRPERELRFGLPKPHGSLRSSRQDTATIRAERNTTYLPLVYYR